MSSFLVYVKDRQKFYDKRSGGNLISRDNAISRLKSSDDKYEDTKILYDTLTEIEMSGVLYEDLKASKSKKKSATQAIEIWEELKEYIKIRKQINLNGQSQIFYVSKLNEATKIDYTDDQSLIDALMVRKEDYAEIRQYFQTAPALEEIRQTNSFHQFLKKMLIEFWHSDERMLFEDEPKQISWTSEVMAYKQMDASKLKSGPTPSWDEFTSRLDFPNVFMAWVWSIFEPTNNIRQIMWLRGAGNDGKSSVQKAIESVIGHQYCYSMKRKDEEQNWFGRNVFGKVLINYADCSNPNLIDYSSIKQVTGGDTTSIEGKGENSFTGKIYAKVLVTSNFLPKINLESQAHTSRLIKIDVASQEDIKKDAGFEKRLQTEIYAFLTKCKEEYEKLISPGGERLELPAELVEKIKSDCASITYLNIKDFIEEFVEFSTELVAVPPEVRKTSRKYFQILKNIPSDQIKFYEAQLDNILYNMGCSQVRMNVENKMQTVWRGFRLKKQHTDI